MPCWDYTESLEASNRPGVKTTCYSTVIYLPASPRVDFGLPTYPPTLFKKELSPRVLLVSTWTDGRWGFVGGRSKTNESPLSAISREFEEETGTSIAFSEEDFCFCDVGDKTAVFVFCRITDDLNFFNSILSGFYTVERVAYPDEVISICGYPLWIEGPERVSEVSWEKSVHGLPRHLVIDGGFLTPTMGKTNIPRKNFLMILYYKSILDKATLERVFELSTHFSAQRDLPLPSFEEMWEQMELDRPDKRQRQN